MPIRLKEKSHPSVSGTAIDAVNAEEGSQHFVSDVKTGAIGALKK